MSDNSSAAWHPDPTGRYAQRYHDGANWTEHVVDAQGVQSTEPVQTWAADTVGGAQTTELLIGAPPTDAPTGGYGPSGYRPSGGYAPSGGWGQTSSYDQPGGYDQPGYDQPSAPPFGSPVVTTGSGIGVGPGLVVAAVGLVLVVLSLFVLDWFGEGDVALSLSDTRELVDNSGDDSGLNAFTEAYLDLGYLVGLVVAGLALVATLWRQALLRTAAVAVLALLAAWHVASLVDLARDGPDLEIGSYAGIAGYVAGLVGAVMGPRRA